MTRRYPLKRTRLSGPVPMLTAVDDVSFTVQAGRSMGIVGESGSGKSTLARLVMALERPDSGTIAFAGEDLNGLDEADLRARRRHFQMVFQDPFSSLDPRMKIVDAIAEPLEVAEPELTAAERRQRVAAMLDSVALPGEALDRYPHEFSGGQRQRVALARALITGPKLVIADEPVSALDVSVQAQVLNLMADLREARGLTYLFISHNLAVVEHVADDVLVLYRGRVVEYGETSSVFDNPAHPYTRALVDAVPGIDANEARERVRLRDDGGKASGGCGFAGRCPFAADRCRTEVPPLHDHGGRKVACHLAGS
ncbi:MAG TPA: ATP-binding cassette domain-containing protein [Beijerinckiaceae bacterium]|nr:ATP-binding cassette domain-containing protein [Beijerinckiaceae bacterium]